MKLEKLSIDGKKDTIEVLDKIFSAKIKRSSCAQTWFTNPHCNASLADNILAVTIISKAFPLPTKFVSRCVPPYPGITPNVTSGNPSLELSEAILIWHDIANSKPPPKAKPLTAAIHGILRLSIKSNNNPVTENQKEYIPHSSRHYIKLNASDADNDNLTTTITNLPDYGELLAIKKTSLLNELVANLKPK